ncbi:MAG TPA: MarC family protein [Gammaproteobacteria bacterium]|nr:MarC family protein [Gammaproteobacteria bacterium]
MFGAGQIFTMMFVMLGPLKLLGPFAAQTRELEDAQIRRIALTVFAIALAAAVGGCFVGRQLLTAWAVSTPALVLAAAIVLFLVALRIVLEQYQPARPPAEPLPPEAAAAAMRLVFPLVLTPYGIATLIALIASSETARETWLIFAMLTGVMLLNLGAMLLARKVMHGTLLLVLYVLGAVLGVLQVALAVQMIVRQLAILGLIDVPG